MIAHILPIVDFDDQGPYYKRRVSNYLHIAQPVTLDAMKKAGKQYRGKVELVTVKHKDDDVGPFRGFKAAKDLERLTEFGMPYLGDIVQSLYEASDADIFIWTNTDITPRPDFYQEVARIAKLHDGFLINRRDIGTHIEGVELNAKTYPLMFTMKGSSHGGIDCVIFRRLWVPKMKFGEIALGNPPIGMVFASQVYQQAKRFNWYTNKIITYHIGRGRKWAKPYGNDQPKAQRLNLEAATKLFPDSRGAEPWREWTKNYRTEQRKKNKTKDFS